MKNEKLCYFFSLGIIFGDIFIPVWFFQGMEKMRFLTIINLVSKGLFTVMVFFVIRKPEDYPLILMLNSLGYISAALISMIIIRYSFKVRLLFPGKRDIIFQLSNGWHIFLSTISMNLYRNGNIFILGLMASEYAVGIYASAEKLIKAVQSLVSPVSEALFPFISRKFVGQDKKSNMANLVSIVKIYFVGLILLTALTFLLSNLAVKLIYGNKFLDSVVPMRILSLIILFGGMNYLLGIIGLLNLGQKKAFTNYVMISGIISLLITLMTAKKFSYTGASYGMVVGELVLFSLCVNKIRSLKKDYDL
jgi:PST family polysaccharide transporter